MEKYTRRLRLHPFSQCHVEIVKPDEDSNTLEIKFISYKTMVIEALRINDEPGFHLRCTGTYSQTTARQISWFLNEYFPTVSYFDMKKIAGTGSWCGLVVCHRDLPTD